MRQKIIVSLSIVALLLSLSPVFAPFTGASCMTGETQVVCPESLDTSDLLGKPTPLIYGQVYRLLNMGVVKNHEIRDGKLRITLNDAVVAVNWSGEDKFNLLDENANYLATVEQTSLPKIFLDHSVDPDQMLSLIPLTKLVQDYFGIAEFKVAASSLNFEFQGKKVVLPIYVSDPKLLVAKIVLVFSQLNDTLQKTTMSSRDNKSIMEVDFRFDDPVLISK